MTTKDIKKLARKYSSKNSVKDPEGKLRGILREVFDALPELTHIEVIGYTPSFNDGDPCYHDGNWYIRWMGLWSECDYFELEHVENGEASIIYDEDAKRPVDVPPKLISALDMMSQYFEYDFGTNSVSIFARQNGKVNFYSCDYDCGY